jgi:uncharacterized protein YjbI with pentapeptide repeats
MPENFQGQNLTGHDFSGKNLEGASFRGAILVGASFEEANLDGADFSDAECYSANFSRASMKKVRVAGANFTCTSFYLSEFLPEAEKTPPKGLRFLWTPDGFAFAVAGGKLYVDGSQVRNSELPFLDKKVVPVDWLQAEAPVLPSLPEKVAIFEAYALACGSSEATPYLEIKDARNLFFKKKSLARGRFHRVDFSGTKFEGVDLFCAVFTECIFTGCEFSDVKGSSQFYDCSFQEASLEGLSGGKFQRCVFEGASIRISSSAFEIVSFANATIRGVWDSKFDSCDFAGATFGLGGCLDSCTLKSCRLRGTSPSEGFSMRKTTHIEPEDYVYISSKGFHLIVIDNSPEPIVWIGDTNYSMFDLLEDPEDLEEARALIQGVFPR